MHLRVDYPRMDDERHILDLVLKETSVQLEKKTLADAVDESSEPDLPARIPLPVLRQAQHRVAGVHVSDLLRNYVVRLISGSRGDPVRLKGVGEHLSHPISPRGSIALVRAAQARAWLNERDHVLPEDIATLAPDLLRHRIGLTFRAEADSIEPDMVIAALLEQVDVV
jgi:MoxR-like ATPase